jgi:hypothetical protein
MKEDTKIQNTKENESKDVFCGRLIKRLFANKYVANVTAAGVCGMIVGWLTFFPIDVCITIAMFMGFYSTLTSRN